MKQLARFSISIDSNLLKQFDNYVNKHEYTTRSEAFRDIIRDKLIQEEWETEEIETVGTLTIIYSHHQHNLQDSLTSHQHQHQGFQQSHPEVDLPTRPRFVRVGDLHQHRLEVVALLGHRDHVHDVHREQPPAAQRRCQ